MRRLTISVQESCASQASLDKTIPLDSVATGEGWEKGQVDFVHLIPCLQICSETGLVGIGTGAMYGSFFAYGLRAW